MECIDHVNAASSRTMHSISYRDLATITKLRPYTGYIFLFHTKESIFSSFRLTLGLTIKFIRDNLSSTYGWKKLAKRYESFTNLRLL